MTPDQIKELMLQYECYCREQMVAITNTPAGALRAAMYNNHRALKDVLIALEAQLVAAMQSLIVFKLEGI